jgi:hypothetical protein
MRDRTAVTRVLGAAAQFILAAMFSGSVILLFRAQSVPQLPVRPEFASQVAAAEPHRLDQGARADRPTDAEAVSPESFREVVVTVPPPSRACATSMPVSTDQDSYQRADSCVGAESHLPPHDPPATTATALPPVVVTTSQPPYIAMEDLGDFATTLQPELPYRLALRASSTTTIAVLEGRIILMIDGVTRLECARGDTFRVWTRGVSTFQVQTNRLARIQATKIQGGLHLGYSNCREPQRNG